MQIQLFYEGSEGRETMSIPEAADFFPTVAKYVAEKEDGKNTVVRAGIDDDSCIAVKVGVRGGTQNVTALRNGMPPQFAPRPEECGERYLALVNEEKNSYKFYKLNPPNGGRFKAEYGRMAVGEGELFGARSCMWEDWMYFFKLYEKLGKGYVDISEYMLSDEKYPPDEETENPSGTCGNAANRELFELLTGAARSYTRERVSIPVNGALIRRADELISELSDEAEADDVEGFNNTLATLMMISQRRVPTGNGMGVKNALARDKSDFGRILMRERDLRDAMKGAVMGQCRGGKDFSRYGVEVYEASSEQRSFVLGKMSPQEAARVKRVWRVIPKGQKERFDGYVARRQIKNVKCLWHGSKTCNWASIIESGLLLHPNASITGKMFGHGSYFAPEWDKARQYTDVNGSYWAGGRDSCGYMGLYAVAVGKPFDVSTWSSSDWQGLVRSNGCDSLWAHRGASLRRDEVVVYDEAASELLYIVEVAA